MPPARSTISTCRASARSAWGRRSSCEF
jgi:hypothetical protein